MDGNVMYHYDCVESSGVKATSRHIYIYLEPKWSLFLKVNPPKQGFFQSKQGSFGFQVYTNMQTYIDIFLYMPQNDCWLSIFFQSTKSQPQATGPTSSPGKPHVSEGTSRSCQPKNGHCQGVIKSQMLHVGNIYLHFPPWMWPLFYLM